MSRVYKGLDPEGEERVRKTAGLMHDLNNDLQFLQGFIELISLESSSGSNPKLDRLLHDFQEAHQRMMEKTFILSDILHNNLNNSILLRNNKRLLNLNEITQYVIDMAKYKLHNGTSITFKLEPDLWPVEGKEFDLERLLVNLVENAFAAIPSKGLIALSTKNVRLQSGLIRAFPEQFYLTEEKRFVLMTVQDNGSGIEQSILPYIFQPAFTTKEGNGHGLGLWVVREIIEDHGGWINVQTAPGQGVIFQVYLPAHADSNKDQGEGNLCAPAAMVMAENAAK